MSGGCSYNCSKPPQQIHYDPDITGIGVVIGYTVTAGIAVLVISLHYFIAFQPTSNPYRDGSIATSTKELPFRPNPVDLIILQWSRKPFGVGPSVPGSGRRWSNSNARLTKCILAMNDLQLATGIAILISGYSQLRCGISAYNWQIVGCLAWFSSLTHLSCLTFLRNYLHVHSAQRHWRLFFMSVLIVMLTTAMAATGGDPYESGVEMVSTDAICLYPVRFPSSPNEAVLYTALLVSLTVVGFVIRIIKLHKYLSISVVNRLRSGVSRAGRGLLWALRGWQGLPRGPRKVTGEILYYPALASFLCLRIAADYLSSMFFEVYWLMISYVIGLLGLLGLINVFDTQYGYTAWFYDMVENTWTFGQVVPVILLVLPLIPVLESLYPGKGNQTADMVDGSVHGSSSSNMQNMPSVITGPRTPQRASHQLDPDANFYDTSSAMATGTAYILMFVVAISSYIVYQQVASKEVMEAIQYLGLGLIIPPIGLWIIILLSFPIDRINRGNGPGWRVPVLQLANIVVVGAPYMFLLFNLMFNMLGYSYSTVID